MRVIIIGCGRVGARTAVAIEVTDSGPGIAPERLPHVFESFQQGDGSATRTIGGMGIGRTPFTTKLQPGVYKAAFSIAGYSNSVENVAVGPGNPTTVNATLHASSTH